MKNYIKYIAMFILILGSMTAEYFPNSEISSSSFYQNFNLNYDSELGKLEGTKFLFSTKIKPKSKFKISCDINLKYVNIADVTNTSIYKIQSGLFHTMKPFFLQRLSLKALFDSITSTL